MKRSIAMVAHDKKKHDLCQWAATHEKALSAYPIVATGTTGRLLMAQCPSLEISPLKSGPLGGDQQIGAMIAEGKIGALVFFQDPMTAQPHDVDIKALVRLATVYDVPIACNQSTADLMVSSPGFAALDQLPVGQDLSEYRAYLARQIDPS